MGERKVAKLLTTQDMIEGHLDTQTLKEAVNEDKMITSRLGKEFASVPMASRLLVENGLLGATPFSTYAAMTASALVDGDYAVVTNDSDLDKNGVYEKVSGAWVYSKYNTQQLVNDLSSVISKSGEALDVTDDMGFVVATIAQEYFNVKGIVTIEPSDTAAITDDLGFIVSSGSGDSSTFSLTALNIMEPLFAKTLCVLENSKLSISVPSLIRDRATQYKTKQMTATFSSGFELGGGYAETSSNQINLDTSNMTNQAYLTLRDSAQNTITQMPIAIKKSTSTGKSPKVLIIGDSISNRGLADMLSLILTSKGHAPVFIGTMYGAAASSTSANDVGGLLGECREGWETGDYTYQVNDRAQIVTDESAYLAMSKDEQWRYNPFLRQSTASDSATVVKNGYVFDPAFYQSRFSLDTPDIVVIQLGTNDMRDRDEPDLTANFISNMTLMVNQIKSAWPSAKVILSVPNTGNDAERNELWFNEYFPILRATLNMQNTLPVTVCPAWAFMTAETGFVMTPNPNAVKPASTDDVTGALFGEYSDAIHPYNSNKWQMAEIIAGYVVCAADNLI